MYTQLNEFLTDFVNETEATKKVFTRISDDSLSQKVTKEGRSLRFIAWHIVLTLGEIWKNSKTLQVLIHHEIHHRAQLTILMRQAGLEVPGIYGPSKEEWDIFGMAPQP